MQSNIKKSNFKKVKFNGRNFKKSDFKELNFKKLEFEELPNATFVNYVIFLLSKSLRVDLFPPNLFSALGTYHNNSIRYHTDAQLRKSQCQVWKVPIMKDIKLHMQRSRLFQMICQILFKTCQNI